jgi:hypothetical protein
MTRDVLPSLLSDRPNEPANGNKRVYSGSDIVVLSVVMGEWDPEVDG